MARPHGDLAARRGHRRRPTEDANIVNCSRDGLSVAHAITETLAGSLGHFWLQNSLDNASSDESEPIAGILQLAPDGALELAGLESNPEAAFFDDRGVKSNPAFIVGATDNGGVFLSGTSEVRSSVTIGGSKASTMHFRCKSLVIDVSLDSIQNGYVEEASAHWHGIARWAGVKTTSEQSDRDGNGLLRGVTIKLSLLPTSSVTIDDDDTELELGSTWLITGPSDARLVSAPLSFTVTPAEPTQIEQITQVLSRVQSLLNIAFQGFVAASSGTVILHDRRNGHMRRRDLWNQDLMQKPSGARPPKSMTEMPLFYLSDIDGLEGVSRWLRLHEDHPRLIRPIAAPYQIGRNYAETLLIDLGTAIDYWRGANKGLALWAAEKFQPLAVANSLGGSFEEWIGEREKWANHFWYHYNGLKHFIPGYKFDPTAVHWLALSGTTAVTCVALLEASAGQETAVVRALEGHKWMSRGQGVRNWLKSVAEEAGT